MILIKTFMLYSLCSDINNRNTPHHELISSKKNILISLTSTPNHFSEMVYNMMTKYIQLERIEIDILEHIDLTELFSILSSLFIISACKENVSTEESTFWKVLEKVYFNEQSNKCKIMQSQFNALFFQARKSDEPIDLTFMCQLFSQTVSSHLCETTKYKITYYCTNRSIENYIITINSRAENVIEDKKIYDMNIKPIRDITEEKSLCSKHTKITHIKCFYDINTYLKKGVTNNEVIKLESNVIASFISYLNTIIYTYKQKDIYYSNDIIKESIYEATRNFIFSIYTSTGKFLKSMSVTRKNKKANKLIILYTSASYEDTLVLLENILINHMQIDRSEVEEILCIVNNVCILLKFIYIYRIFDMINDNSMKVEEFIASLVNADTECLMALINEIDKKLI